MVYKIEDPLSSPLRLTQSVIQITEMLNLYQAELARLLGLQCGDIGRLTNGKHKLIPETEAWQKAVLLLRLYQALYDKMQGDGVAMCHWLRADNTHLNGIPLMLMVDEGQLARVQIYVVEELAIKPLR